MPFEVTAGPDGRYLVQDRGRRYVVPAALGRRLSGVDGRDLWRGLLPTPGPVATSRRLLWSRVTLVPAAAVARWCRVLRHAACWPALAAMAALGLAGALLAPGAALADWGAVAAAVSLFLLSALWHELGHAAALSREGWPPGRIGGGVLVLWPVLWSDVSCTALLPRPGRVRVDLAGVCFQLGFVGLVGILSRGGAWPPGGAVVQAGLAAVAWSLLPLVRSDGHWLACDLLGIDDLAQAPPPHLGARRRRLLAAWRLATMLMILLILVSVPWRLGGMLARAGSWPPAVRRGTAVALAAAVVGGGWRAGRRLVGLAKALRRDGVLRP